MTLQIRILFFKYSLLFILLLIATNASAQKKIALDAKHTNNRLLLQEALNYIKEESKNQIKAFQIGHSVLKETTNKKNKLLSLHVLTSYHYYKYSTDSTLLYAKKAINLIGNNRDSLSLKQLSSFYLFLSNASRDKNLLKDSKKWALKGIETAQKCGDNLVLDRLTISLANAYRNMGDTPKALNLLQFNLINKNNLDKHEALALCFSNMKKYDKALLHHQQALNHSTNINNQRSKAIALMNIGVVYLDLYKDDKALLYFKKSLQIAKVHEYSLIILNNLLNISVIYREKKELKKVKEVYNDVLITAQKSGHLKQQLFVYQWLKEISIEEKKYKTALEYTHKKNQLQDSINKIQKDKDISKLEIQYETLKKEKEITVLRKNQELKAIEIERQQFQKKILKYAFIIITIPLIGLLILYYQKLKNQHLLNKKQKEIGEQKIEALIREQELKLIKNSLKVQDSERTRISQELHDRIGGNLAAIKLQFSLVKANSKSLNVIYQQLDDTCKQVRILSHELIPEKFKHTQFTLILKEYMKNIGNASNLKVNIYTYQEDDINELNSFLHNELFAVLQELITNTIKHANAKKVDIQIDLIQNTLFIIYEDNGDGYDTKKTTPGIGLININNRIQNLSGTIDNNSQHGRGTMITIKIQISEKN